MEKKLDKIILKDMKFMACHGVYAEEKVNKQPFIVSVEISRNLQEGAQKDNINKTLDYTKVYDLVENIVIKQQFDLIESLAEAIVQAIIKKFSNTININNVHIILQKPQAKLKNGKYLHAIIDITRYN